MFDGSLLNAFVELNLFWALLTVAALVIVVTIVFGIILSYFDKHLGIVRLISAILATVSIVFFAFEKRDALVEAEYRESLKSFESLLRSTKIWAENQRESNCIRLTFSQILNSDNPIRDAGQQGIMCAIVSELSFDLTAL